MSGANARPLAGPMIILGVLALSSLLTRPLVPVDETRYVGVAWEMWLSGDYFVMSRNGIPYSHKPPLLFWLINLGWAVFGVNEWWPRLLSPLFSLGSLLLTAAIGRTLWSRDGRSPILSVWILASSLSWMIFSTAAMFDVMLAFIVLLGLWGLLEARQGKPRKGWLWYGAAIGLGLLAKGPAVLLHLLTPALAAPWWFREVAKKTWYTGLAFAVLGGATLALAWVIPAVVKGGEDFRDALLWGQTAHRVLDSFAHKHPFWWYAPWLPVLLFPWLIWPPAWSAILSLKLKALDPGQRFCLAWLAPAFVAFSLISGKQIHYLVPLLPGFALFVARLISLRESRNAMLIPTLVFCLLGAAMLYCALFGAPYRPEAWIGLPWWPGAALILLSLVLAEWVRRRGFAAQGLAIMSGAVLFLCLCFVSDNLRAFYDLRPMADAIRDLQQRGIPVAHVGHYHDQFQFIGRLEQALTELKTDEIRPWLDQHPNGAVLTYFDRVGPKAAAKPTEFLFSHPHRMKTVMLLSSEQAKAWAK